MKQENRSGLQVKDFSFAGELGSEGARIRQVGYNHFKIEIASPMHGEGCPNRLQFTIRQNAKGNQLRLDVSYNHTNFMRFDEYFCSWSYDKKTWQPIEWEKDFKERPEENTLLFAEFAEDTVYVGHQVPMSYEDVERVVAALSQNMYVEIIDIGQSLEGRNIHRIVISDGKAGAAEHAHYFAQQHPGEHNAQWRMMGMIEWLLSEEAGCFRKNNECHFVLTMSPDAPSRGWYRANTQFHDMNRTYLVSGSDSERQTHEAWLCQRDLEQIAGHSKLMTVWAMHTWGGKVEMLMRESNDIESKYGSWTLLRDAIIAHDQESLCKPLYSVKERPAEIETSWGYGPFAQFGVTSVLCEGSGSIMTKEKNMLSGKTIIQGLADYFAKNAS